MSKEYTFSDLSGPIAVDEIRSCYMAYSVTGIVDQLNFMQDIIAGTTDEMIKDVLLEIWEDNEMESKKNFPKTVEEYIKANSYLPIEAIGDGFRGSHIMKKSDVKEMIDHYFKTWKPSEDLSAEDFVKAININLDTLIASLNDVNDSSAIINKTMLEYTKNFINEFVETAVIKTDDKEKTEDHQDLASVKDIASDIIADINSMVCRPVYYSAVYEMMLAYTQKLIAEVADIDAKSAIDVQYDNIHPTKLKYTIPLMDSDDYKLRFKAEYYQLKIRIYKLQDMIDKWDNGGLDFTPTCPRSTYELQLRAMKDYLAILEMRAGIEDVSLK